MAGQGFGCGRSRVWVWQVKGLDVAGQGFARGRSGVWTWQVKGFGCGRSKVWVWQVKGLGVAGQGFGRGRPRAFPSNMASEEPGRETGQRYYLDCPTPPHPTCHLVETVDSLMCLCVISQLMLLDTGKPVDIAHGSSLLMNSQEIQAYEDYDGCIMAFLGNLVHVCSSYDRFTGIILVALGIS